MNLPVLVGLLLAMLAIAYVVAPLVFPQLAQSAAPPAADAVSELALLRDDLLGQIVALDFDHAVGKTDEAEYQEERLTLKRQTLAVLRSLDEQTQPTTLEATIEREVSRVRAERAAPPPTDSELNDEIERQVVALRQARGAGPVQAE